MRCFPRTIRELTFSLLVYLAFLVTASASADDRVVLLLSPDLPALGVGPVDVSHDVMGDPVLDALARDLGIVSVERFYPGALRKPGLATLADRLRVLRINEDVRARQVAEEFALDSRVIAAEVPSPARLLYTPNDPSYPDQWYLPHVGAPRAWDHIRDPDTRGSVVAVIDTGLDLSDPDLAPSVWINPLEDIDADGQFTAADLDDIDQDGNGFVDDVVGWDFADNDPNPQETHWHGSGVSACISAATDNGVGVAAIGFGLRVMVLKAIADGGVLVDGYVPMLYAADNDADVINCSWGIPIHHAYEQAIVDAVWDEGVVLVASGGAGAEVVYPAGYDNVFAVSATDSFDHRAGWAPFGETIDIMAPGVDILTIQDGGLTMVSGTSFASGLVAGLAGLLRAASVDSSPADVLDVIESTAVDIDSINPGYEGLLGAGRIDAGAALGAVTDVIEEPGGSHLASLRCFPNPLSEETRIRWEAMDAAPTSLEIFSAEGALVASISPERLRKGSYDWRPGALAAGVYFVRLRANGRTLAATVSLVK